MYALEKHQVLIVEAETGSGKSTQICQYLADVGYTNAADRRYMIGVTQPRRVAAATLAARVAEEMNCELGSRVGFSVRFDERIQLDRTEIKFMTDGVLLRELLTDPLLDTYSVIMLDEAHERTINSDLLIGLLAKVLRRRPLLRMVIASATVEADQLQDFYAQQSISATILSVPGRQHALDVFYAKQPVADYVRGAVDAVIKIHETRPRGDVLVFFTSAEEIENALEMLKSYSRSLTGESTGSRRFDTSTSGRNPVDSHSAPHKLYVLPLYAALPASEQTKVLEPFPRSVRKVVLATNVAETSLTIPGITFVVDCGFVKCRCFDSKSGNDALIVQPISKAAARQRAGRAGRTQPGQVFRLYTKSDHDLLADHSIPEMQRTELSSVLLQLKALGINNLLQFRLPSPPPTANVIIALEMLFALDFIDSAGRLTDNVGMKAAELPLPPQCAKMLLASADFGCSEEALTICAMLQIENIFQQPMQGQRAQQARNAKRRFAVQEGDLITYLNVYNGFIQAGKVRSWADRNHLHYNGLLHAIEVRTRLMHLARRIRIPLRSADGDSEAISKCIVAGYFANAAYWNTSGFYRSVRGSLELHLHPSSVLNGLSRPPAVVVYVQLLHTSRRFIRDVIEVKAEWLHQLAPHFYEFGTQRELNEKHLIDTK